MINEAQQPTRSLLYQKEAAQAAFPALAAHFFPSQRCCHNQNTLQRPQSESPETNSKPGQVCNRAFKLGHPLFCISRGGVSITEQPAAKTRSWLPVRITRHSEIHQPSEARGLPQKRGKRAALQTAISYSAVWGGGNTPRPEASAELCEAVSRLVLLGSTRQS